MIIVIIIFIIIVIIIIIINLINIYTSYAFNFDFIFFKKKFWSYSIITVSFFDKKIKKLSNSFINH
jgi:hypothetical protein